MACCQQRAFACQVFELHRLIKVQRSIAASPHLLHDDAAYFDKPAKPLPGKKRPLDCADNAVSNAFKAKVDSEKPSHKKEHSAENTFEKSPFSSAPNTVPPSSSWPSASVISSDHNDARTPYLEHPMPQGHQWLIPVMSPTEGLVYKPCPAPAPAPGFIGQGFGGANPVTANFLAPVYGVPAMLPQHPFPSFPPYGPHGYFPQYGMPVMNCAAFSGSSVGQMPVSARESTSTAPSQMNGTVPDRPSRGASEAIEVPGSRSSSSSERQQAGSRESNTVEGRDMLPLFPASSPATDASDRSVRTRVTALERGPRVIKVVPHNAVSASESAARIFQSIQEERKQYDI